MDADGKNENPAITDVSFIAFVPQGGSAYVKLSRKTRYPSVRRGTFAHSAETFPDSSAPS